MPSFALFYGSQHSVDFELIQCGVIDSIEPWKKRKKCLCEQNPVGILCDRRHQGRAREKMPQNRLLLRHSHRHCQRGCHCGRRSLLGGSICRKDGRISIAAEAE
ncbi:hypothetical protein SDJN02_27250, partial [Cucurbita argyrosperma subsp. argyrosperma]